jgi:hypothetical protein
VVVIDAGATLVSTTVGDVCTIVPDSGWACEVGEDSELELTVTTNAPAECQAYDTFNSVTLYDQGDLQTAIDSVENVSQTVPADPDLCDQPEVRKRAVPEYLGDWQWSITLDNRGENTVAWQVELTDPDVSLRDALDSDACSQLDDAITCDLPADEQLTILVTRDASLATCESRYAENSITQVRVRYADGDGWSEWETLGAGPLGVVAEVSPNEGSCIEDPSFLPPPVDDGENGEPGCTTPLVALAAWSPEPYATGWTISIWGGGTLTELMQPPATAYWTLVDGEWVSYIPEAPGVVNAQFLVAFADGEVPPCQGFVIFHKGPGTAS